MHQPGANLDHPFEMVARTERVFAMQPLGMQKRKTGKYFRVEPVGLGVFVVVVAQIGGLLGRHQHHLRTAAPEPGRQRDPGVARRLHRYLHPLKVAGQPRPQRFEFVGVGAEPVTHK